jgi:hypothetical protein
MVDSDRSIKEHLACLHEQDWGMLFEVIKTHTAHVVEGDAVGGFRDRLVRVEVDLKALKERFWQSSLIGGIIGALVGSGSKDIIQIMFSWFVKK